MSDERSKSVKKAAHLQRRVAPAPPSRSATGDRHGFVHILSNTAIRKPKNQSLWCLNRKSYAEGSTFYVTSITLNKVPFTLLGAIGSLSPLVVALITSTTDLRTTTEQMDRMEKIGDETVTKKREPFLDNPYKAPKDTGHETAKDGRAGMKTTALSHSTPDLMPSSSCLVLGDRLPRLSGGTGRNGRGAKKAPSELVRTGGASLCHPSPWDVVKAIPSIHAVRWFPFASNTDASTETVSSSREELSWWKSTRDEERSAPERCGDVQGLTHLGWL